MLARREENGSFSNADRIGSGLFTVGGDSPQATSKADTHQVKVMLSVWDFKVVPFFFFFLSACQGTSQSKCILLKIGH